LVGYNKAKYGVTILDTLYFLQTSYREETGRDPIGTVEWRTMQNIAFKVDYSYRTVGILGTSHAYSRSVKF